MGWNYSLITKLQWCTHLSLEMDKYVHTTLFWAYDYLSMLGLKLICFSPLGPWDAYSWYCIFFRWRSCMEVKIMAGSLFVHCKIAYIYSVTAEKWLVVSLPNFVMIRMTHLPISCKIFSWIRTTKLKIHAMEFCDFIKDSVSPSGLFVPCSLTVTSTWRPRLTAHCPIREPH